MNAKRTGEFIARLRKEKGYSQKELAGRLSVTDKAISRWETGKGFPDVSLLEPLSEALDVSVGELLAGERISREETPEKTDQVILESLRYAGSRAKSILNLVLALLGMIALFLPFCLATSSVVPYWIVGCVLLACSLIWLGARRANAISRFSSKGLQLTALICLAAAFILEISPCGVVMHFAAGPDAVVTHTYSYFSLTPFGYANFSPLPTGVLTGAVLILLAVGAFRKNSGKGLRNTAFALSAVVLLLSLAPLLFGLNWMSPVGWMVSLAIFLSVCFQAAANRKFC